MMHALFSTLPGRVMVAGAAAKLTVLVLAIVFPLPAWLGIVDTLGSIALVLGGASFLVRGFSLANRRLLWRVRRKLIVSYIFIGVVPAILIVMFFLLGGLLLFSNFSSYLLQSRLRALSNEAASIAATTAIEIQRAGGRDLYGILSRRVRLVAADYPGASLAVMRLDAPCGESGPSDRPRFDGTPVVAGDWAHVEPPRSENGRVDHVLPVGGADDDDVLQTLDPIDLAEQLRDDGGLDVG